MFRENDSLHVLIPCTRFSTNTSLPVMRAGWSRWAVMEARSSAGWASKLWGWDVPLDL